MRIVYLIILLFGVIGCTVEDRNIPYKIKGIYDSEVEVTKLDSLYSVGDTVSIYNRRYIVISREN